jgi:hypothetical protein
MTIDGFGFAESSCLFQQRGLPQKGARIVHG